MKALLAIFVVFALLVVLQMALKRLAANWQNPGSIAEGAAGGAMLLSDEAERLGSAGSNWPEIIAALNPQNDPRVRDLLFDIRGSNMFVPGTGLDVISAGCRKAIAANQRASALEALQAAKMCMSTAQADVVE